MNRLLLTFVCLLPLFALVGCGSSVSEQAPPEESRPMTPEEEANYEDQMKMMQEQMQGKSKGK